MKRRTFVGTSIGSIVALNFIKASKLLANGTDVPKLLSAGNLLRSPAAWDGGRLTTSIGSAEVWPGVTTQVITTGGYPGVTISKRTGDMLDISIENKLNASTAIHWHGFDVPSDMDGHPSDQFVAGATKNYAFEIKNRAGMYFYHSHAHESTARQVYNGLYGLFRVGDPEEDALALPSGEFEIPIVIQDVQINAASQLKYNPTTLDNREGYTGNKLLANGTPDAYTTVKRGTYRLRLVNASNARLYKIAFSDGREFQIIGSDGGLLSSPVTVTSLPLAPSERYDLLVSFADVAVGANVALVSSPYTPPVGHMGSPQYPQGMPFTIVRFDVVEGQASVFNAPPVLSSIEKYQAQDAVRTRVFDLEMQMTPTMPHTINGKLFEMDRVDFTTKRGELEIWEFVNKDVDMTHPMHIHGGQFQILARNGSQDIPAWERGWKDTIIVSPNEHVQVGVRFNTYAGIFLVHCHILEHEDIGMMLNFEVVNPTDVREEVPNKLQVWYNPSLDAIQLQGSLTDQHTSVVIVDEQGRSVHTSTINETSSIDVLMPARALATGVYSLLVGNEMHRIAIVR